MLADAPHYVKKTKTAEEEADEITGFFRSQLPGKK